MTADKPKIYYICIPSCKSITHCEDAERAESLQMIQITWVGIPSPRSAALYQFIISCQYCIDKCNICCVANWMDWNTSSRSILFACSSHQVIISTLLADTRLRLARRPFFVSPANTCLRLARRPVFASPVAPSSPRPSPRLRLARRPVFASPVAPSSPRPSPRGRPVIVSSLWYRCIL
ncbi:uncharacterized protein LOC123476795 isoform X1 [Daphnia magna]|uniref:uncharacterized protein LOC123476795 isoform X1 n=1 Tax=Daphnia magna TaxID=35525 RepID=UPI001E1BC1F7|nr:uncharacterized protein LOC123476795 isoform X1 [Daphnia magna]